MEIKIVELFKLLLFINLAGMSSSAIFNKKFGDVLFITLAIFSLITMISGMVFNSFTLGYIFIIIWLIIGIFVSIYKLSKKKITPFSSGYIAFLVFLITVIFIDYNAAFSEWDDFSHWGPMVKSMYTENTLFNLSNFQFSHHDYPPVAQIVELLICKAASAYKESYIFMGLHLLEFSLLLPLFERLKKVEFTKIFISILMIFITLFLYIDDLNFFVNVYKDCLLAFETASIFYLYYKNEYRLFDLFSISITTAFMLLTKEMGICIYLLLLFMNFIFLINLYKKSEYTKIKFHLMLVIIPVIPFVIFNIYKTLNNLNGQFNIGNMAINAIGFLTGSRVLDYQMLVINKYIDALLNYRMLLKPIPLTSYFFLFILFSVLLIYACKNNKKQISSEISISLIIGFIIYAIVLLGLYLFGGFSEYEARYLASYERYLCTYLMAVQLFITMLFIENYILSEEISVNAPLFKLMEFITVGGVLFVAAVIYINPLNFNLDSIKNRLQPSKIEDSIEMVTKANIIEKHVVNDQKTLIVNIGDNGEKFIQIGYYLSPLNYSNLNIGTPAENDIYKDDMSYESFLTLISEYDYIYTNIIDNELNDRYFSKLNLSVEENKLYKINCTNNNVDLVYIDEFKNIGKQ